jgi:hypothetical protein
LIPPAVIYSIPRLAYTLWRLTVKTPHIYLKPDSTKLPLNPLDRLLRLSIRAIPLTLVPYLYPPFYLTDLTPLLPKTELPFYRVTHLGLLYRQTGSPPLLSLVYPSHLLHPFDLLYSPPLVRLLCFRCPFVSISSPHANVRNRSTLFDVWALSLRALSLRARSPRAYSLRAGISSRRMYHPDPLPAFDYYDPLANIAPLLSSYATPSVGLSVDIPVQNHPAVPLAPHKLLYHRLRLVSDLPPPPTVPVRRDSLYNDRLASLSVPPGPTALLVVLLQLFRYADIDYRSDYRYIDADA